MTTYIGPLPVTLLPNTLADATQVMSNFNWIVNQVNANVPSQTGGTYTNITVTGSSNIFTGATFFNGTLVNTTLTTPTINNGTLNSPALAGIPTTPTQSFADASSQVVNSAWVRGAVSSITGINLALASSVAAIVGPNFVGA